eukprot:scaffold63091_cov40-Cyclotella_meneghiniana.AAC.1
MTSPIYLSSSPPLASTRCRLEKQTMAVGRCFRTLLVLTDASKLGHATRDQVVKSIEGATNHFPPRIGVKMPSSGLRYPLGRLDAFASVDVHSHFNIEGDTDPYFTKKRCKMPSSLLPYPLGTQGR